MDYEYILKHELGHWFASRHFGFNETYISIKVSNHSGGHRAYSQSWPTPDLPDLNSVCEFLEKRIVVLMAGAVSEAIKGSSIEGTDVNKIWADNGQNDYALI
ncbi:hypothetical protein L4C31_22085, partial [Aliivibrio sifiae]